VEGNILERSGEFEFSLDQSYKTINVLASRRKCDFNSSRGTHN
jgi:hypothetical protein